MRLLILGGCGYIGSRLYLHLKSEGHEVDTVDLELRGNPVNPKNKKADYRRVQIFDYDAVLLLAGHSSVGACETDPHEAFKNNLVGLVDLVRKLRGQPLIYASSASVYSIRGGRYRNMYDFTKQAGDDAVKLLYSHAYGLRFGTVCGSSPNMRHDLMVNGMVRDALTKGRVSIRNPEIKRPILGMNDLCRSVSVILKGDLMPGIYNLASFNGTVGGIGHAVAMMLGVDIEELKPTQAYDFEMPSSFPPKDTVESIVAELKEVYQPEVLKAMA